MVISIYIYRYVCKHVYIYIHTYICTYAQLFICFDVILIFIIALEAARGGPQALHRHSEPCQMHPYLNMASTKFVDHKIFTEAAFRSLLNQSLLQPYLY